INLVEKIAQLANISINDVKNMNADALANGLQTAAREMLARADKDSGAQGKPGAPKEIVKEGLSEYFIFTIEGTETVPNGWSKRLRSIEADAVPFKIQYRYRPQQYGDQLVRMY